MRASYRAAIAWIVDNDDTEWAEHPADSSLGTESVTASLVADIFEKSTEQVRADIVRALAKRDK